MGDDIIKYTKGKRDMPDKVAARGNLHYKT